MTTLPYYAFAHRASLGSVSQGSALQKGGDRGGVELQGSVAEQSKELVGMQMTKFDGTVRGSNDFLITTYIYVHACTVN